MIWESQRAGWRLGQITAHAAVERVPFTEVWLGRVVRMVRILLRGGLMEESIRVLHKGGKQWIIHTKHRKRRISVLYRIVLDLYHPVLSLADPDDPM